MFNTVIKKEIVDAQIDAIASEDMGSCNDRGHTDYRNIRHALEETNLYKVCLPYIGSNLSVLQAANIRLSLLGVEGVMNLGEVQNKVLWDTLLYGFIIGQRYQESVTMELMLEDGDV